MKFLYPLGLLGLIGVPVLIIIYLIKNKYTEQTVPSTWLWELSEKFLKRKKKVNPIAGLISLILQILAVTAISFAIAQPVIVLPNQAKEICYIVDASASMNMQKDGQTRFERAKAYLDEQVSSSVEGSVYSLLYVSENTEIVCEKSRDKKEVKELIAAMKPGYMDTALTDAIELAQSYFSSNPGVKVYLLTDVDYKTAENVEVINFADGEQNYAVSPLDVTLIGTKAHVSGSVSAYAGATPQVLTLELLFDGSDTVAQSHTVEMRADAPTEFSWTQDDVQDFASLRVRIANHSDALAADDESIFYNVQHESAYDTVVVSDQPYLISSAIEAASSSKVKVVSTAEYKGETGYGLYVFDGYTPTTLPTDGTIWFMNLKSSVSGTGFSFQGEEELPDGETLSLSTSTSSLAQRLTKGLEGRNIYISKYIRYGRSGQFTTVMTYKSNPVVFVGTTADECREVVFAFDIHASDMPLSLDFVVLVRNLLDYSYPSAIEKVAYLSGETLEVNLQANMQSVRVDAPSGNHVYLSTYGVIAEYPLDEIGTHKITVGYSSGAEQRVYYVYAGVPETERNPYTSAEYVGLQGEATDGGLDGTYDPLTVIFIILALVFLADWGVYCYEKYQLR